MNKNKKNLIVYTLAYSLLFSGWGITFSNLLNINNTSKNDFTTSIQSDETTINTNQTEINIEETTIPVIEETKENTFVEENIPKPTMNEPIYLNEILCVTNNTNIYSNSTALSLKVGEIKLNEKAIKILSNDNWTLVNYNNTIGYICNDYLKETNESIESKYKHEIYNDVVITTTNLNFRKEPNIDSEIISTFIKNTELEVIAKVNNNWLLVRNNGTLGYVNSDYTISLLNKVNEIYPDLNLTSLTFQKIVYSKTNDLNIRNGNNNEYETIEKFDKYESARVIKEYDDWYFVMTNEYNFGFINKKNIEELNGIYVIVDLSRQLLYLYNDNILCLVTPVITGKPSTPSDIGLFKIWYRGTECYITDNAFTHFWMAYNYSMEGLHDATKLSYNNTFVKWRDISEFMIPDPRKEIVHPINGSNGCINMMLGPAETVFENTEIGTKVLVHK